MKTRGIENRLGRAIATRDRKAARSARLLRLGGDALLWLIGGILGYIVFCTPEPLTIDEQRIRQARERHNHDFRP